MSYLLQMNILMLADDFAEAFRRCTVGENPHKDDEGCWCEEVANIPAIVNAAFSCELYIKSMISESNKEHNLKKLFAYLSQDYQNQIKDMVNSKLRNGCLYNFDDCLEKACNVFVEWRYIFENEHSDGYMGCNINQNLTFFQCILPILKDLAHK